MLGGGLAGSLGIGLALNRHAARVARWPLWALVTWSVGLLSAAVGGVAWTVTGLLADGGQELPPGWKLAIFGFCAGAFFALPTAPRIWWTTRRAERRAKTRPKPTKAERVRFADDLRGQIESAMDQQGSINTTLTGDRGTVLVFEGPLTREQGEGLVRTLRADFQDVGIERVEGAADGKPWWVRV